MVVCGTVMVAMPACCGGCGRVAEEEAPPPAPPGSEVVLRDQRRAMTPSPVPPPLAHDVAALEVDGGGRGTGSRLGPRGVRCPLRAGAATCAAMRSEASAILAFILVRRSRVGGGVCGLVSSVACSRVRVGTRCGFP